MRVQRCKDCGLLISFARKAEDTNRWAVLDSAPVTPAGVFDASAVRIVSGQYAYRLEHLKETLEMRRDMSTTLAHDTAAEDFPWHNIHHCKARDKKDV